MNFDQCLIHAPAENAPYITAFGVFIFSIIFVEIILAVIFFAYDLFDPASFLAAAAAAKTFLLMFANFQMTAVWRAFRNGIIVCSTSLNSSELTQTSKFNLKLHIQYPFTHASNIEALRWIHTDNLKIHPLAQESFCIQPHSDNEIIFSAETLQSGYGRILGLGVLTISPFRCFRAENHIEFNMSFPILPMTRNHKPLHSAKKNVVVNALRNQFNSIPSEYEPEDIRPWQNTDTMRKIAWKYYAKSGKLMVWHPPRLTKPALVCLIDAGPSMRLARPDHNSCLCIAISMMAQISSDFQIMTVIAYNETNADIIAENRSPNECLKSTLNWLLKTLEWNPHAIQNTQLWNDAVQMIHRDFRLYKHVNFTQKANRRIMLDSKALAEWAKTDLALTAVDAQHPDKAAQILKMPPQQMLISLIKQRSRTTQPPLMPSIPKPALMQAVQKLKNIPNNAALVWFSDFASPLSAEILKPFVQRIKKQTTKPVAVCLPPPIHALNFIASQGEKNRKLAFFYLKKNMIFIESSHDMHNSK